MMIFCMNFNRDYIIDFQDSQRWEQIQAQDREYYDYVHSIVLIEEMTKFLDKVGKQFPSQDAEDWKTRLRISIEQELVNFKENIGKKHLAQVLNAQ